MRLFPILFVFLYIYIEVSIFVAVADAIGVLLALIALGATSLIGISLVKSQGLKNIAHIQQKMQFGENPNQEVVKSVLIFVGGLLLLLPGFLTDIIGALLLLPVVQKLVVKFLLPKMHIQTQFSQNYYHSTNQPKSSDDVIDGTFSRKDDE